MGKPAAGLYDAMVANVIPPAQVRYGRLLKQYLAGTGKAGDCEPPSLL